MNMKHVDETCNTVRALLTGLVAETVVAEGKFTSPMGATVLPDILLGRLEAVIGAVNEVALYSTHGEELHERKLEKMNRLKQHVNEMKAQLLQQLGMTEEQINAFLR